MTVLLREAPSPSVGARTSGPHRATVAAGSVPLTLVVVSDSPVIRLGVQSMLASYRDRVRVAVREPGLDGPSPVPDVLLVDTGSCACVAVRHATGPGRAPVLLYGRDLPALQVRRGLAHGCAGHVDLRTSAGELLRAVEAAGRAGRQAAHDGGRVAPRDWPGGEHGLSRRESDVLCLISAGLTNDAIAERSGLSVNTVKSYIRSAYRKVGVTRRSEAVRWGIEHGVVVVPDAAPDR